MGLIEIQKRLRRASVNLINLTADAMEDHPLQAENLNRRQLMAGKGADGNSLPLYRNDPYFKGNAKWISSYEKFKDRVSPGTPHGVMNLFINGYTHSFIRLEVVGQGYRLHADGVPWGKSAQAKTGGQAFGLNLASRVELWDKVLAGVVKRKFYEQLLK
jgi:hypothetical protein